MNHTSAKRYLDTPIVDIPTSARNQTRECEIYLGLAPYTYFGPESFTLLPQGQHAWLGIVVGPPKPNAEEDFSFVALMSGDDDSVVSRDSVVSHLKNVAIEHGFNMCEVNNHFHAADDSYETLYRGPIYQNNAASL